LDLDWKELIGEREPTFLKPELLGGFIGFTKGGKFFQGLGIRKRVISQGKIVLVPQRFWTVGEGAIFSSPLGPHLGVFTWGPEGQNSC